MPFPSNLPGTRNITCNRELNIATGCVLLQTDSPVIDGVSEGLLAMPIDLIGTSAIKNKPLIIGTNKDEGTIFLSSVTSQVRCVPSNVVTCKSLRELYSKSDAAVIKLRNGLRFVTYSFCEAQICWLCAILSYRES